MNKIASRFGFVTLLFTIVLSVITTVVAQETVPVYSPAPSAAVADQPTFLSSLISLMPMLVICYFIFYFMVIKPQEARSKKHKTLLESLKRGDSVVTSSGIVGKVAGVEKDYVFVEVAPNVKVKVQTAHVAGLEAESASAA